MQCICATTFFNVPTYLAYILVWCFSSVCPHVQNYRLKSETAISSPVAKYIAVFIVFRRFHILGSCSPPARWGLLDFMSVACSSPPLLSSSSCSTATLDAQCSLSDLNHDHPRPVFPAGPQPRPSTPSVPCRTSTTTIHAQCSLPNLNREYPRQVFPAGPHVGRYGTKNAQKKVRKNVRQVCYKLYITCKLARQCAPLDLKSQIECQKICQIERQIGCEKICQIKCHKICQMICQIECQIICQNICQKICQIECRIGCQKICQIECQNICQKICQIECQKVCQIECQKVCQKICQKICQIECQIICQNICQKICQIECRIGCQKICQIECQNICQKICQKECQIKCQNVCS